MNSLCLFGTLRRKKNTFWYLCVDRKRSELFIFFSALATSELVFNVRKSEVQSGIILHVLLLDEREGKKSL